MLKFRFLFVLVVASAWQTVAFADSPLLPIQGRLLDAAGYPIDEAQNVTFAIYPAATGSTAIYQETQTVGFTDGHFVAYLGDVVALDPSLFDGAPRLWLGITIQGDAEMQPRFRLGSAPTAGFAHMCGDAATLGGVAASDFAPAVHSHVAWVDAKGDQVAEALPWAPPWVYKTDPPVILVRDNADVIWALDVYTGDVRALFGDVIFYASDNCTGEPHAESAQTAPPPRFAISASGSGSIDGRPYDDPDAPRVVVSDTATPRQLVSCSQRDYRGCTAIFCRPLPDALPVSVLGSPDPVFPYLFPLHPELH